MAQSGLWGLWGHRSQWVPWVQSDPWALTDRWPPWVPWDP